MKSYTFKLPSILQDELTAISKAYDISISELIRNGCQIITERHYSNAVAKLEKRPDIDKVLNNN